MPKLEDNKIAARYSKALFDSALEAGQLEETQADLNALVQVTKELPGLRDFFANPAIPQNEKETFVKEQLASKVSKLVGNLLMLMAGNGRMSILAQLAEQFSALVNQHHHVAKAEVITAVEMDGSLLDNLQKALESRFGFSRVELHNRVEPGILGGAIVKIQDQIIDGSFSGRLETLKKQLVS